MPIKGLSETRRIPRIGKIHLGHKHPEKGYPMKDDHFVFNEKIPAEVKAEIAKLYGNKVTSLDIIIPTEDDEYWCSQYYRLYSASQGLICKGDGTIATCKIDTATGAYPNKDTKKVITHSGLSCAGKECPSYKEGKCHEVMNLQFLMPKVAGLGIWQIDTGSINSIININSCAELIRGLFKRISMIPLKLTLEPKEVNNPESGKKQTVFVLNLRHTGNLYELIEQCKGLQQQLGVLALPPAPDDETIPDDTEPEPPDPVQAQKDIDELFGPSENKKTSNTVNVTVTPSITEMKPETQQAIVEIAGKAASQIEKTQEKPRQQNVDLLTMEFKNPGEFYTACLRYFKLQKSAADKEIPEYDLANIDQRKRAWNQIVGVYGKKE
jgi:hypothetical protein